MSQPTLIPTRAMVTAHFGQALVSFDRSGGSYFILAALAALILLAGACYYAGVVGFAVRLSGELVRSSIRTGFLVWERLFARARWPAFLLAAIALIGVGNASVDLAPLAGAICGLASLFMGVTACLAYMHIDIERYAVERGYKSIHNPLKGQELARDLILHGDRVDALLLASAAAAAVGGFALLNQGLFHLAGSHWYAPGDEPGQPTFVDFLAYSLINLYSVVDFLDLANTSQWLRLAYVRPAAWPARALLTAFKAFFSLVLIQQIFASVRQGQALAETIADFWSPHPPIHERARTALPRHGVGVVRPLLDSLGPAETLTKEQRDRLPEVIAGIGPAAGPLLLPYLGAPNESMRVVAAASLGRLRVAEAAQELSCLCTDRSEMVRQSAAAALGAICAAGTPANASAASRGSGTRPSPRWSRWLVHGRASRPGQRCDPVQVAIPALVRALGDPSAPVRITSSQSLGLIGPTASESTPALVGLLADPDETVRCCAAESIGRVGGSGDVGYLIATLSDPSSAIREAGARALGSLREVAAAAVEALVPLLQDREQAVRKAAADAVAAIGSMGESATATLVDGLAAPDTEVRALTAEALGSIGDLAADAARALADALADQSDRVRGKAAESLGQIGEAAAEAAVPGLTRALRDRDNWVSALAAEALGEMGEAAEEAVPALAKSLRHVNALVRANAAEALGKLGPAASRVAPGLKSATRDPDGAVRAAAVRSLADVQPDAAALVASEATSDSDPQVRAAAVLVLGSLGTRDGTSAAAVLQLLDDPNDWVKVEAVRAIPKMIGATPEAVDVLTRRLGEDDSGWVRETAAEALGQLGPDAVTAGPVLLRAALTGDASLREQAVRAIARIQPPETSAAFKAGLLDASDEIRLVASAGWMKAAAIPEDVVPVLVDALRDPLPQVRANAAHALSRLETLPPEAVPRLIECAADANDGLRINAAIALSGEASTEVVELFRLLEEDPNSRVRLVAAGVRLYHDESDSRSAEIVEAALADPAPRLRHLALTAVASLGSRGEKFRIALRIRFDRESDPELRARLERVLARLGQPE